MKSLPDMGTGVVFGARTTALFPESDRLSPKIYRAEYAAACVVAVPRQPRARIAARRSLPLL